MSAISSLVPDGDELHPYKVRAQCGHVEERMMGPTTAGFEFDPAAEWQVESQTDCAVCLKHKAEVRAAQSPPIEGQAHVFYPEMHEAPAATRLFKTRFVWRNYHHAEWLASRDAEAREVLRSLKIRPRNIQHDKPGEGGYLGEVERFSCTITSAAHEKLAPHSTHERLLD